MTHPRDCLRLIGNAVIGCIALAVIAPTNGVARPWLLQDSLHESPDELSEDPRVLTAVELLSKREFSQAVEILEGVAEEHPRSARPWYLMSVAHYGAANYPKALDAAKTCLSKRPEWPQALWLRAGVHVAMSEFDQADAQYVKSINIAPDQPGGYLQRGRFLILHRAEDARSLRTGIDHIKRAAKLGAPESTTAGLLGIGYRRLGDVARAEEQFRRVLQLMPENIDAVERLVQIYNDTGRSEQSKMLLARHGPKEKPPRKDIAARWSLILARQELATGGDDAVVDRHFQSAISADPANAQAALEYAQWLETARRHRDAIPILNVALEHDPKNSGLAGQLAWALAETNGNLDEARKWLKIAQEAKPGDLYLRDTAAWILFQEGRFADALATLEPCLQLADSTPEIAFHAGAIYDKVGQPKKAVAYLRSALRAKRYFSGRDQARDLLKSLGEHSSD